MAETVGVALDNLSRRQELAENLDRVRDENVQLRERLGVQSEIVGTSPVMVGIARRNRPRGAQPGDGAGARRKRRGQGACGPGGPFLQPAPQGAVRLFELRGLVAQPAGQRTVRPRARSLHRAPRSARSASSKRLIKGR